MIKKIKQYFLKLWAICVLSLSLSISSIPASAMIQDVTVTAPYIGSLGSLGGGGILMSLPGINFSFPSLSLDFSHLNIDVSIDAIEAEGDEEDEEGSEEESEEEKAERTHKKYERRRAAFCQSGGGMYLGVPHTSMGAGHGLGAIYQPINIGTCLPAPTAEMCAVAFDGVNGAFTTSLGAVCAKHWAVRVGCTVALGVVNRACSNLSG